MSENQSEEKPPHPLYKPLLLIIIGGAVVICILLAIVAWRIIELTFLIDETSQLLLPLVAMSV